MRRRLMMQKDGDVHWGEPATNVYVIDPPTQFNERTYNVMMPLGGGYYYDSEYPIFASINSSSGYHTIYAFGHTYRNGGLYGAGQYIGTVNGIDYYDEGYARHVILHSNMPVLIWGS